MIDRQNYEIWFLDFLDGKLLPAQETRLRRFLAENPDLAGELSDLAGDLPLVTADAVPAPPVSRKKIVPAAGFDENNFETAFIAWHEGDLSGEERNNLDLFLQRNPFLRPELDAFGRLSVTHSGEMFPGRPALKRRSLSLVPMFRYAAAASLLLLVGWGALRYGVTEAQWADAPLRRTVSPVAVTPRHTASVDSRPAVHQGGMPVVSRTETPARPLPERRRLENVTVNGIASVVIPENTFHMEALRSAETPAGVYESAAPRSVETPLTVAGVLGKVIEAGVGENAVSDGLARERKITAGDMVDLAAAPFKKSKKPVLSAEAVPGGKHRVSLRLGFFEADFALR